MLGPCLLLQLEGAPSVCPWVREPNHAGCSLVTLVASKASLEECTGSRMLAKGIQEAAKTQAHFPDLGVSLGPRCTGAHVGSSDPDQHPRLQLF